MVNDIFIRTLNESGFLKYDYNSVSAEGYFIKLVAGDASKLRFSLFNAVKELYDIQHAQFLEYIDSPLSYRQYIDFDSFYNDESRANWLRICSDTIIQLF